ncbi:hypothetical protein HUO14_07215 [Parasphingorhabdus flavimaris]|uniref:DUF4261 domain-containing protein n=1 Tax=Parasphingorhabdus flavimaris TaxID=266812 RepID=A0ABX2N1U1_9SPHN|nr:hypothetical protein [Parasphingorhabdus flavimaris]NVD27690.1 hypothetical protein [Parasphingorhabdus flavimaris]
MISDPALLIVAPMMNGFDLAHFPWPRAAGDRLLVNGAKFDDLDMLEVIVDGMPFLLSRLSAEETRQKFADESFRPLSGDLPYPDGSAIGIGPRDIVTSARHLPEINCRLLMLGKWIGTILAATAAAWGPSGGLVHFADYDKAVSDYLAGGPFPPDFQICFAEERKGRFLTRGLAYFADREIRLSVGTDYEASDVAEQLARIVDDIVTHGKIDIPGSPRTSIKRHPLSGSDGDDHGYFDISFESQPTITG